jgi:hypothetical protein
MLLFQAMISKGIGFKLAGRERKLTRYRVLGILGGDEKRLLVQSKEDGKWSAPLFLKSKYVLDDIGDIDDGIDGIVCWSCDIHPSEIPRSLDLIELGKVSRGFGNQRSES